jgi:hypothetical protein
MVVYNPATADGADRIRRHLERLGGAVTAAP